MSLAKYLKHKIPRDAGTGNKYGAKSGDGFPSGLERKVNQILELRVSAGEISDLRRQVRVELTAAAIATKVDFSFEEQSETRYAEAKGAETERWRIIKKLWRKYGPGHLEIWVAGRNGEPFCSEVIKP